MLTPEGLPIVDRTTVAELVVDHTSPIMNLMRDFDQTHPAFGGVIVSEMLQPLGEESVKRVILGAVMTGVLLEQTQKKVGGTIPAKVSREAVGVALLSWLEHTDEEMETIRGELMRVQIELFTGLRFFEHNILARTTNDCRLGGVVTLLTYNHLLASQALERTMGFEN